MRRQSTSTKLRGKRYGPIRPRVEWLESRIALAVFTVTSSNDAGLGSFRQAILDANSNVGQDMIAFDVNGGGIQTIIPLTPLPSITDPITIDGSTQTGYAGSPLVELDGSQVGPFESGLEIEADGCMIRGLIINRFPQRGIYVINADNTTIVGNYIGTDVTGSQSKGNNFGIDVFSSGGAVVGGTTAAERNIISGNSTGIWLNGSNPGNVVQGNFIGTDRTGTKAVPNLIGIRSGGPHLIGGTVAGAANLISGNTTKGVYLSGSSLVRVQGNYIGTSIGGDSPLGNGIGIEVENASNARIGGTAPGSGNVISGNVGPGISMFTSSSGSNNNLIFGNRIGTDAAGTVAVANEHGVVVGDENLDKSTGNRIGGSVPGAGNIISGNRGVGVLLRGVDGNSVEGNVIGLSAFGASAVPNQIGVALRESARQNTVGSPTATGRNIISGNTVTGVEVRDAGSLDNLIQANFIGTDATGQFAVPNAFGVYILFASNTTIGGGSGGAGNLISGNFEGVTIFSADDTRIEGNLIGTDASGAKALGNLYNGISIQSGSGNVLGGLLASARNVISANGLSGVAILAQGNFVQGNYIGTNLTGNAPLPNATGIYLAGSNNVIGGSAAGATNLISGNTGSGIEFFGMGAINCQVAGNRIGTNATSTGALSNEVGILIDSPTGILIGGTTDSSRNVISGNTDAGIRLLSGSHTVQGNYVGIDALGTKAIPNTYGIYIEEGANQNTIGGTIGGARNVISGNDDYGLFIRGDQNIIQGNHIGPDPTGTIGFAQFRNGVRIEEGSYNLIGGPAPGSGNLISGNGEGGGVTIVGGSDSSEAAVGNIVQGNRVGTDISGTMALPNAAGVSIGSNAPESVVGGTAPGASNLISGNSGNGVAASTPGTIIQGNWIGIDVTGTKALGNGGFGVSVATQITIGGWNPESRNVISGNGVGVRLNGSSSMVLSNFIGTDISGTLALGNGIGVRVDQGANNAIGAPGAGNVISGSLSDGISIFSTQITKCVVQSNFIGTDVTGTKALANLGNGIDVSFSGGHTFGGAAPGEGNVISGNQGTGIYLAGNTASANVILGNKIGTDVTGAATLANDVDGVRISGGSSNVVVGTAPGGGNVISGNRLAGVNLGSDAKSTLVQGNLIGTDWTGTQSLGNGNGVRIGEDGENNVIGGTLTTARNIISGNLDAGVLFAAPSNVSSKNFVQGNFIGTDWSGTQPLGNSIGLAFRNSAEQAVIGGTTVAARNIISGNTSAGLWFDEDARSNQIQGNYIGTDVSGLTALGNGKGVFIVNAFSNTIGGTAAGAGNLISGNIGPGIELQTAEAHATVQGNWVGLDVTGIAALGNGAGILLQGAGSTTIGGTSTGAGNVISGNVGAGITIAGAGASSIVVSGNFIGTDISGLHAVPNSLDGVALSGGSNHVIGGTTTNARNVIAGNREVGIRVTGSAALIQGNFIGVDVTGAKALGNKHGAALTGAGFTLGGTGVSARNIISGNIENGIILSGTSNKVQGNFIGTDWTGTLSVPNDTGVLVSDGLGHSIGGLALGARNIISGNTTVGLRIMPATGSSLRVEGNFIGTDVTGTAALANGMGVWVAGVGHLIGGNLAAAGNVVSANLAEGILIDGSGIRLHGNFIGSDWSGQSSLGNSVGIVVTRSRNFIGGNESGAGNLISGNLTDGIQIAGSRNTVQGNRVGTTLDGLSALPNGAVGVFAQSTGNAIGGRLPTSANVIAFNGSDGVRIDAHMGNTIRGNSIFENGALGIRLTNGGNHDQEAPHISLAIASGPSVMLAGMLESAAATSFVLEFFAVPQCDPSGAGEGQRFLGSARVTTDELGAVGFELVLNVFIQVGEFLSGTATDPDGNTSEFSLCREVAGSRGQVWSSSNFEDAIDAARSEEFLQLWPQQRSPVQARSSVGRETPPVVISESGPSTSSGSASLSDAEPTRMPIPTRSAAKRHSIHHALADWDPGFQHPRR